MPAKAYTRIGICQERTGKNKWAYLRTCMLTDPPPTPSHKWEGAGIIRCRYPGLQPLRGFTLGYSRAVPAGPSSKARCARKMEVRDTVKMRPCSAANVGRFDTDEFCASVNAVRRTRRRVGAAGDSLPEDTWLSGFPMSFDNLKTDRHRSVVSGQLRLGSAQVLADGYRSPDERKAAGSS